MELETIAVRQEGHVAYLDLNRPDKANAINERMWQELRQAMQWVDRTDAVRVAVLGGAGRHFCAGIDLSMLHALQRYAGMECRGRAAERLRLMILDLQDTVTSIERCRKPVIARIHGACVGGGIDVSSACDMRYCSSDAYFSVKEVDVGLTADVGTLQRLPRLIGEGMARELAYTARRFDADEAARIGLVNRVYGSQDELVAGVRAIAGEIASKAPLAVRGTKEMITYVRDHSVADGLNYIATWNAGMLVSSDLEEALAAVKEKRPAKFLD
ncbi:crotonase/enoyl-CoA hydratase family protein [Caldimonas thermodepolymerans]|jgi:Enoyl-CoA hydratase/carnithine racemase|uniref:Enoyl-CoA hydratase n=1 Tax=Caldimonas thermodepolymerans TaxID=215580 RepID=A0A2S5T5D9_9BURK|nr:crotonase/enoyl-CoA hydratase family protein [Caldimonas thermodepolymerans]PPE70166.1 crotonase/enoyl-CoA hydratase family protein [Caldimonas thermodepolymerans]QPC32160.1 crotonase/enoyl-CoA hydratase family protein [Caldimonas thermodepolymerans]RDH98046.1 enoyl-CoA hydratase [Caldimonas thermodepolymerans]TCP08179.1 enoyl-CoA hydratase [Caldimonas thermodepolymerans]UZG44962.1 crotonase/enoyl-CoA hydratase family protein [Caldimonas thermodepolymerans]